ncbi:type II and III secretion system protein family protein [Maribius pontilimi]|uniref:Type II and III secretion system protein family protein n=1 Tax=Palleronia pontilimi TaxID=1964209 RepID=A0A934MF96_9RHOB|nr:type II and III secretion system protein family protein [Palleronia pontilimi]MBJ3761254.1 type II and III secretion system protein family protein [Palleronia pontilimi]
MSMKNFLKAAVAGLALCASPLVLSSPSHAQALRVMQGTTSSELRVPMNRAVVVESDQPFAELSIANPAIADISTLSDRTIYVLGKAPGRTTLTLLNAEGRLITNVEVQVIPDVGEFKERLRQILPNEQIEVRTANDGIVLSGTVSSITALDRALDLANRYAPERVSNLMMVGGTQQVMLKVRFAEMSRSVSKQLSSSVALGGDISGGDVGILGANGTLNQGNNASSILSGQGFVGDNNSEGSLAIGFGSGSLKFAILLEALESKGVVRTLAEPNLVALSGQKASFLAGGEYPIPVASGDDAIRIEYKPFGVELDFIPRVLGHDVINIELTAAVSGLDPTIGIQQAGFNINGFSRRESQTTIELRDGESFAIAGLLEDDFRDLKGQVPWLGDIPVLGALFRSSEYEREQSELVIIITAHLVTPVRGEALALPTDRVVIPTERELFLFGEVVGGKRRVMGPQNGPAAEVAKQDFSGSYGYVME